MSKTLCSQCRGPGFNPWLGNKIPHATIKTWYSQINNIFKKRINWITNKDLLYSTGNSAQCFVAGWIEGEFG